MKISLLYTTARPWLIPEIAARWRGSDIELIVVTDEPVTHQDGYAYFVNSGPRNCVAGWNLAASKSTGDILVQVSDDTYPPEHWAERIRAFLERRTEAVLNLLDEDRGTVQCHHPVLTRAAYLKAGCMYPSEFESLWCDNWFHEFHRRHNRYYQSSNVFWAGTHSGAIQDRVAEAHCNGVRHSRGREVCHRLVARMGGVPKEPEVHEI